MKKIIFICISVFVTCLFLSFNHKAQQEQASIIAQAPKTCPRCGGNGVEWKEITKTCSSCKGRKTLGKQDGSVDKEIAAQARGPEFESPCPI